MGAAASAPSDTTNSTTSVSGDDGSTNNIGGAQEQSQIRSKKKRSSPKGLSGAKLVEYRCRKHKRAWNKCISEFYNGKFLTGGSMEPDGDCDELFDNFRSCYMKGMLKEREKNGLPPPQDGSMLHEFIEEEAIDDGTTNS
mmetsp:Transcript_12225/g.35462  ORF Transcript_12225/g.35462 Transcript_12225/m.35462 type:complete len:140 (-) Transcript_12225:60-479(-)